MNEGPSARNNQTGDNHPSVDDLEQYHDGSIETTARMIIETHIADCLQCSRQVEFFEALASVVAQTRPKDTGKCPSDEALLGFLEGNFDTGTKTTISDHVNRCDSCADRIFDFSTIMQSNAIKSDIETSTLPTVEIIRRVREKSAHEVGSTPERRKFVFPSFSWNTRFVITAMAAATFIAVAVIMYSRSRFHNIANHPPHQVVTPQVIPNGPNHLQKFGSPIPH